MTEESPYYSDLKPCPFCGAKAHMQQFDSDDIYPGYRVECAGGHALDWYEDTPQQAAALWNQRPSLQAARRRGDRLRRALEKIRREYSFGAGGKDPYVLVGIATQALMKDTNE